MEIPRSLAKHREEGSVAVAPNCSPCLSWDTWLAELSLSACPGGSCTAAALTASSQPCLGWVSSPPSPLCAQSPHPLPCTQTCLCLLSNHCDDVEPACTHLQLSASRIQVVEGSLRTYCALEPGRIPAWRPADKRQPPSLCQTCPCKQAHISFPLKH